jgi:calcineurin-like phosphoesterase family protein
MTVFFISDTHFGDHRVLNLYPRPFASVAAMDAEMIARWNTAVGPEDEIWHLGDFARTFARAADILSRLNGRKHLVLGNNDPVPQPEGWASIANYAELRVDGVDLVLCHYPFRRWKGMDRGSINLHGHSHGRLKPLPRQFDVGADVRDFRPVILAELLPAQQRGGRRHAG